MRPESQGPNHVLEGLAAEFSSLSHCILTSSTTSVKRTLRGTAQLLRAILRTGTHANLP